MRVLYWTQVFLPHVGGIELLAARLLPALAGRGVEPLLVTDRFHPDLPERDEHQGVPVYRLGFREALTAGNLDGLLKIRRQIANLKRTFRPDVVHITFNDPSCLFHLQTLEAWPAPMLVTLQSPVPLAATRTNTLSARLLAEADWITCVSGVLLEDARRRIPDISTRSSVIYNAQLEPELAPTPLPFNPPTLLYLGRLSSEKGVDLALEAMARVAAKMPGVRLVIAGDGVERTRLEGQTRLLSLTDRVEFRGWVKEPDVLALMNAATLVLMPSRLEGLPLVAIEAAFMARPVVAARIDGMSDAVVDGETGCLVDPEQPGQLADAILDLLQNAERAQQLGEAARRRARKIFNWDGCVEAYLDRYRYLAAGASAQLSRISS